MTGEDRIAPERAGHCRRATKEPDLAGTGRLRIDFLPVCSYATTSPVNAREEKGTWNA
ncbi:hypothetical protein [Acetobacter fallax]|uniref:Uncharacterized protein n=1 Tax=Acetobacter fallax TaxID=1737473 RepID=A0ABX0K4H0_9PROT|nr:hypothetical protein [Acetobacter fallax]NHO31269.1 hypothetical protein [Acetobacter fallax]NHO34826.1 hypothetical protein [Acetobacter fallax]